MILAALHELYERRVADPDPTGRLPAYGREEKEIPFILEIDSQGNLVNVTDTRSGGKKPQAKRFLVPQAVKKTSGVAANLLWDNAEYVLGVDLRGNAKRVGEQHAAFVTRVNELPDEATDTLPVQAVNRFLENFSVDKIAHFPVWEEIKANNPNMTFRLVGDAELVCQRSEVVHALSVNEENDSEERVCLITGKTQPVERLHTAIKGVWGAQTSGANIVSFNADAYSSYGKEQGENSPVGKQTAFAYTTALNDLLRRESRQRMQVGDASTVFWAKKPHDLETAIPDAFGESPKDDPGRGADAVRRVLEWVKSGKAASIEGDTRFYVLGLAPNAARIAVRFWEVLPLRDLAQRTLRHYEELKIARGPFDPEYPSLFRLLASCATQGKSENIPPNLGGDVMRAILTGGRYPETLYAAAIRRCRAEQQVNYLRAAVIKACLNRSIRFSNKTRTTPEKEYSEMLDPENQNTAYRLGRLFAVLEKIQEEANPGLNATIRDRYYGAASSTPVVVFTTLLRLHHHHLAKLPTGRRINFERLMGEVMAGIEKFPANLHMADQGSFALGYYHQRQALFTKSSNAE